MFELSHHFYNSLFDILTDIEFVKKGRRDEISNVPCVFDIEASSFYVKDHDDNGKEYDKKQCCMYAWVFGINGKCIRGRTWEEFLKVLDKLVDLYELNSSKRLIIYVHNLSYEFQFFKKYFNWTKVFCVETRKPVYAITDKGIEFRCSYLLSGFNLQHLGENLTKYKVKKLVGDLDYSKLRTSTTPLTDTEWGYILNDGLVVMAHIQEEIERLGNITKLPITKTGYVREMCRQRCIRDTQGNYRRKIRNLEMNRYEYELLKKGFYGGFTHGNHNFVGKTIKVGDTINKLKINSIGSFDLTSSYPTVAIAEKFPMSPPRQIIIKDYDDLIDKLNRFCCLFEIKLYNVRERVTFEHYISQSKCSYLNEAVLDNGRVVEAECLVMTITEQDYFIIEQMYDWEDMEVGNFHVFIKDYLPQELIEVILDLYGNKTSLKDIEDKIVEYLVSKGMINSVYGMMVTDPCKDEITYDNIKEWTLDKMDVDVLLAHYNKNQQRFLYYAWGIWITAYARTNLFKLLLKIGDHYVYADTDSLKVINYEDYMIYFEEYNKEIAKKINKCLYTYNIGYQRAKPKNKKGIEKPLGIWEFEGRLNRFKTLGAKRYIYEKEDGSLMLTISGVNKTEGLNYLLYKFKTTENIFKNFKEGLIFPAIYYDKNEKKNKKGCGKLTHTYLDDYMSGYITDYLGNEGTYCEMSGVHLEDTSYNMSLSETFKNYLKGVKMSWIV